MRHLPLVVVLAGCPAGGTAFPTNSPSNPAAGCELAGTEYLAGTGELRFSTFTFNGQPLLPDQQTVTTCIRSDGAGAAWLFDLAGEPFGILRIESDVAGSILPTTTNLVLDLYGAEPTAQRFDGTGYAGAFTVSDLDPFTIVLNGQMANAQGSTLQFLVNAEAQR
jgi:hypothetical protein